MTERSGRSAVEIQRRIREDALSYIRNSPVSRGSAYARSRTYGADAFVISGRINVRSYNRIILLSFFLFVRTDFEG